MYFEKKISGIEVSLETDMDGAGDQSSDRVSGCWLNYGDFSGSLDLAFAIGGLEDRDGNFLPVKPQTLETIEGWALSNGY